MSIRGFVFSECFWHNDLVLKTDFTFEIAKRWDANKTVSIGILRHC